MTVWKRMLALTMCGTLIFGMAACKGKEPKSDEIEIEAVEEPEEIPEEPEEESQVVSDLEASISWWTYPVFVQDEGQEEGAYEQTLIQEFNKKYPNIRVELRLLDYTQGPDEVQGLIDGTVDSWMSREGSAAMQRPGFLQICRLCLRRKWFPMW